MRLYEKRAARRYWHMVQDWNHCRRWWCLGCHWRHIIGEHERRKRWHLIRINNIRHTIPKVKMRKGADGRWRRDAEMEDK